MKIISRLGLYLCLSAFSVVGLLSAAELVLATQTKSGGVTVTTTAHRVQSATDGSLAALDVFLRETTTLNDGTVLADKFPAGEKLTVPLSAATIAAIEADIAAAKAASDAAKAAAAAASH